MSQKFPLSPMVLSDFDLLRHQPWFVPLGTVPTGETQRMFDFHEVVIARARLSFMQDPRERMYKVVVESDELPKTNSETETENTNQTAQGTGKQRIIALARWSVFNDEHGFQTDLYSRAWKHKFRAPTASENLGWEGVDTSRYNEPIDPFEFAYDRARQEKIGGRRFIILTALATHIDFQRRGAGRMLMDELVRQADELQLPVHIRSSPAGKRLYESIGCVETGDVFEHDLLKQHYMCFDMVREPRTDGEKAGGT